MASSISISKQIKDANKFLQRVFNTDITKLPGYCGNTFKLSSKIPRKHMRQVKRYQSVLP